jgi:hypothetical protein
MPSVALQVKRVTSQQSPHNEARKLAANASKNFRVRFAISSLMAIAGVASMAGFFAGFWRTYEGSLVFILINETFATMHGLSITMIELKMSLAARRRRRVLPSNHDAVGNTLEQTSHD